MLITVNLPWDRRSDRLGSPVEVYQVELVPSELDGDVCVSGRAECITGGNNVPLPPYIAAKDIARFIQVKLGWDHGSQGGGRLD